MLALAVLAGAVGANIDTGDRERPGVPSGFSSLTLASILYVGVGTPESTRAQSVGDWLSQNGARKCDLGLGVWAELPYMKSIGSTLTSFIPSPIHPQTRFTLPFGCLI